MNVHSPYCTLARLLGGIADALAYLHRSKEEGGLNLVHSDLKPKNILVNFGADARWMLCDFGMTTGCLVRHAAVFTAYGRYGSSHNSLEKCRLHHAYSLHPTHGVKIQPRHDAIEAHFSPDGARSLIPLVSSLERRRVDSLPKECPTVDPKLPVPPVAMPCSAFFPTL